MAFDTEFPDYPAADMPSLPKGFEDSSWHNDACPSYSNANYQIWIDYAATANREFGDKYPRFNVCPMKDGIEITGNGGLQTDDWNEVLKFVETDLEPLIAEYAEYCKAQGIPHISADEHELETLTPAQREWIKDFQKRWEAAF